MGELPEGTVTFLFTDVEGSTRLWEAFPRVMRAAVARHNTLLRQAIESFGGVIFRTVGDGICAAFATAPQAVSAALWAQLLLQAEPWDAMGPLRVRMALHAGAAEVRDGDYVGSCLNRVGRLLALANGGQVVVSDVVSDLASDSLPEGASLLYLGEHRLRDLVRAEHIHQLVHPDLLIDFPPLKSLDAYPNNLPLQLSSFVGRDREVAEVKRLLSEHRLVTLTGAGGSGKTRLALQIAADLLDEYLDGAWVVELAPLADPELVPQAVAYSLGLREHSGQSVLQTLVSYLKPRQLLLVVDNCEHLLEASARLVETLLTTCPRLRVLATSREMLGAVGEVAWRVPSLTAPDPRQLPSVAKLAEFEAIRLFVERARAVQPAFTVTERNASALAEVCARLDGIPLAIELAAAMVRALTVEQIAGRLGDRFKLLTGGRRTALRRQQTLRATIDWSYDLLSEVERTLFRRLSVFVGDWSLEAAEGICSGGLVEAADVLGLLLRLVDKSLVTAEEASDVQRYRLPETIRQYSEEKLFESGEVAEVRKRHLGWYLSLADEVIADSGHREVPLEMDNLRGSLEWSLSIGDASAALRLVIVLSTLWLHQAYYTEGRRWLNEVLAQATDPTPNRAWALNRASIMAWDQGDLVEAKSLAEESLSLHEELGLPPSDPLNLLGMLAHDLGDRASARTLLEQSLSAARQAEDANALAFALSHLGLLELLEGNYGSARTLLEESLAVARKAPSQMVGWNQSYLSRLARSEGHLDQATHLLAEALSTFKRFQDKPGIGWVLCYQGYLAGLQGESEQAIALLRESLELFRELGHWPRIPQALRFQGFLDARLARYKRAVRLIGAAQTAHDHFGSASDPIEDAEREDALAASRSALGEEAFARAWAEGQAMTLEQAVEYALADGVQA